MAIGTGHGATIAFGTSSFTASFLSIGSFEQTREALDNSHLGTTNYRSKTPGDLVEPGEFTLELFFNPEDHGTSDDLPPITAAAETVTITLPISNSGNTTNAAFAGSAFVTSWGSPEMVTDSLMQSTVTVQWATGPTYTEEAA